MMWRVIAFAGLCAGNPVNDTSSAVQVGVYHPWAYGIGTLEAVMYTCNHPRRRSITVVSTDAITSSPVGSHSSIWVSAYAIIAEARFYNPGILYLIVQPASNDHYNLTVCETMPSPTVASEWGDTELYVDCGTSLSVSPTPAPTNVPTVFPTAVPTANPTLANNPMSNAECNAAGGTNWDTIIVDGVVAVRYCCNHVTCDETYTDTALGLSACACPAVPGESYARDNTGECFFCSVNGIIAMTYCEGDSPDCNSTYSCPTGPLLNNACVGWFPAIPSASPTESPTAVPTASPTYSLSLPGRPCWTFNATVDIEYGPMSEAECTAAGGSDWATVTAGSIVAVRYCCNHPACDEVFLDSTKSLEACACPPGPGEPTVRNNTGDCQFCVDTTTSTTPFIAMTYCDTAGCTGTHTCNGQVYPTDAEVFYDACTADYTPNPQCSTVENDNSNWCKQSVPGSTFYQVANVTVEASSWPGLLNNVVSQRHAVYSDFDASVVPDIRTNWVEVGLSLYSEELQSGACWCQGGASTRDWFPAGLIRQASLSDPTVSYRSNASVLPPPRDYYPRTSSFLYLQTLYTNGEPALVSVYTYDGTMKLVKLHLPQLAISSSSCATVGCTHLTTHISLYGIPLCRFVCAAVLSSSAVYPNTILIDPSMNMSACTIRPNFVWIQHAALAQMVVSLPWQHAADTVRSTQLFMWVPWMNLTTPAPSNCDELALQYCSLELTYYATMEAMYCAWNSVLDTDTLEWVRETNIVGVNDWWADTGSAGTCGSYVTETALHLLVPTIYGISGIPDDNSNDTLLTFRREFYNLFWENMAARSFGYDIPVESTRCNGTASFLISTNMTHSVSVVHGLQWFDVSDPTSSACVGLDGCATIGVDVCASVPGCRLAPGSTVTSTSTQTTVPFATFPPVTPPTPHATMVNTEQTTRLATLTIVTIVTLSALIAVAVISKHTRKLTTSAKLSILKREW